MAIDSNERDTKQRTLGFLGFSAIAHVILLIALMFMRLARNDSRDSAANKPTHRGAVASANPHSRHNAERIEEQKSAPTEILLADANDPTGVEVPKESLKAGAPAPVVVVEKPVEKGVEAEAPPVGDVPVVAAEPPPKPVKAKIKKPKVKTAVAKSPKKPLLEPVEEAFQSNSIKPAAPVEENPEQLTPVIADEASALQREEAPVEASQPVAATEMPAPVEEAAAPEVAAPSEQVASGNGAGEGTGLAAPPSTGSSSNEVVDASLRQPLRGNPLPTYPTRDRLAGKQGMAVVTGKVGTDGRVSGVQIEQSSGSSSIDQASVDSFKQWKFAPGPDATVRKSFAFNLSGEAKVARAQLGTR